MAVNGRWLVSHVPQPSADPVRARYGVQSKPRKQGRRTEEQEQELWVGTENEAPGSESGSASNGRDGGWRLTTLDWNAKAGAAAAAVPPSSNPLPQAASTDGKITLDCRASLSLSSRAAGGAPVAPSRAAR